jgi:hypothetical protein
MALYRDNIHVSIFRFPKKAYIAHRSPELLAGQPTEHIPLFWPAVMKTTRIKETSLLTQGLVVATYPETSGLQSSLLTRSSQRRTWLLLSTVTLRLIRKRVAKPKIGRKASP